MASFNKLLKEAKQAYKEKDEITYYWKNHIDKRALISNIKPREINLKSGLCTICQSIDIRALLATRGESLTIHNPDRKSGRRVLLGLLTEILASECRLCRLVARAVSEAWQLNTEVSRSEFRIGNESLCCYLAPVHRIEESNESSDLEMRSGGHLRRHPVPSQGLLFVNIETISNKSVIGDGVEEFAAEFSKLRWNSSKPVRREYSTHSRLQTYLPELRLLALDAPILKYDTFGLGVIPGSLVDLKLAKLWYATCREHHHCGLPHAEIPGMRLIDTIEMNIVPATSDREYAALSYVWGRAEQPQSLESNYVSLQEQNSLLTQKLPKTIFDAINVTREMGIHFLWVDSLCIIQDSKTQKQQQIESMDRIYSMAAVTIVAASGEHANAGLPGVATFSRSIFESQDIQGLRFTVPPPPVDKMIARVKWNTRGWCYQEWKLSRRLMIFTDTQVYFSCQSATFCESIDVYKSEGKLNDNPQNVANGSVALDPGWQKWSWPVFKWTLHEYSLRDLTFEDDVLLACLGVLTNMKADVAGNMIDGLPSTELVRGMLWQPGRSLKRRSYSKFPFPSWSWTGWVGPVNFESFSHWSVPVVRNWFYRDTTTLIPLGAGSARAAVSATSLEDKARRTNRDELEDNAYETYYNPEPALAECNGANFPEEIRFTASPEVVESLKTSKVVLVPSQSNPKQLEYALESSLTPEELGLAYSPEYLYGIDSHEKKSENGVLQFYTECARLTISVEQAEFIPRQGQKVSVLEPFAPDDSTRYFRIVDPAKKNQWIGIVQLPVDFFGQGTAKMVEHDFVLISASKLRRRGWEEHVHKHCKTYFLDKKGIRYFFDEGNWYTLGINALMVSWRRGVAYRTGLAKIHYIGWDAAQPQGRLVTLG